MHVAGLALALLGQSPQSATAPSPQAQVAAPAVAYQYVVPAPQVRAIIAIPQERPRTRWLLESGSIRLPRLIRATEAPQALVAAPVPAVPQPLMTPAPPSKVAGSFAPPSKESAAAGDDQVLEQLQAINRNLSDLRDRVVDLENSRPVSVPANEPPLSPLRPIVIPAPGEQRSTAHPAQD